MDTPEKAPEIEVVETPVETAVEFPAEGSVVKGTDGHETVAYDRDEDGNVTGWHKEVKNG